MSDLTTTPLIREAVVDNLNTYLPTTFATVGIPVFTVEAVDNQTQMRPDQLPKAYLWVTGFDEGNATIGGVPSHGNIDRTYSFVVEYGVISKPSQRDVLTWGEQVADCIVAVINSRWNWPTTDFPNGMAQSSGKIRCELSDRIPVASNLAAYGRLDFEVVVRRRKTTTGGE